MSGVSGDFFRLQKKNKKKDAPVHEWEALETPPHLLPSRPVASQCPQQGEYGINMQKKQTSRRTHMPSVNGKQALELRVPPWESPILCYSLDHGAYHELFGK
jgi:hypothetical protein